MMIERETERHARPIRDLPDFHLRWQEFRDTAVKASSSEALSEQQRDVIKWLILMADKIGPRDLS